MSNAPEPVESVQSLILKYTNYLECEEWHTHSGEHQNADPNDGHMDYDEDKFAQDLSRLLVQAKLEGAIEEAKLGKALSGKYEHRRTFQSRIDVLEATLQSELEGAADD